MAPKNLKDDYPMWVIPRESYPETLANMHNPPVGLYVRGKFPPPDGNVCLCVVGSRKWTHYGRDAVHKIITGLKGYPITIVSGLAIGIDSIAHMAALEAGLNCIAFPGSSLNWESIYPRAHADLAKMILDSGGGLVSRWPEWYETGRWAFPARNTLMAGLSHATLIVEAGFGSGSLMTAKHAEEYGRDVFAIPGEIYSPGSYGPHMLIRKGAALISCAEDLLVELGFEVAKRKRVRGESDEEANSAPQMLNINLQPIPKYLSDDLSARIIDMLKRKKATVDDIFDETRAAIPEILQRVTLLELEGFAEMVQGQIRLL